jgi:hypothetical protein
MPAKTGGSHALAALVSLVLGTVLSKYVWTYTPSLAEAANAASIIVERISGVSFSHEFAGTAVVVVGLSFIWGVLYHVSRHG